jgi:hypothetical protein
MIMRVSARVFAVSWRRRRRTVPWQDRPEEEVLDDRELAEYLGAVHLEHATVDLVPCLDLRR